MKPARVGVRVLKPRKVQKALNPTKLTEEEGNNSAEWISPDVDMRGLKNLVNQSTILPQCIRAYKNNIAGFGIGIRYRDDIDETEEMKAEYDKAMEIIELLNLEMDTKEVFEDLIEARETYGIAYLEVIRDLFGNVVQIEFIEDTESIQMTRPLDPYIPSIYFHKGRQVERKRRYRKFKQQIGGKTVYFKEFGDPRIMDLRTGEYVPEGEYLDLEYQANELIDFPLGTEPYGTVRWIGQILSIDGSRRAEILNNNYFINGRHTPLMIMVKGGTLSQESFEKLQEYIEDIKGEAGQHAFVVLETEATDGRADWDQQTRPEIEVKDLANILQRDELFGNYLEDNRKKVQSAFQLPDLYVAYTTDFNRATAQTAQEITEKQVFQPERKSLAWVVNNKLLNGYNFKYVEAYFLAPDITNVDDLYRVLTAANYAGGVTPNFAKKVMYEIYGEVAEDYQAEWADIPLSIYQMNQQEKMQQASLENTGVKLPGIRGTYSQDQGNDGVIDPSDAQAAQTARLNQQITNQINKAMENKDDEIVAVMKEVRKALIALNHKESAR